MLQPRGSHALPSARGPTRAAPRELPTITYAADGCVMAHWHNIGITVWGTRATLLLVKELEKLTEEIGRTHPKGSTITLVIDRAPPPTSEARTAIKTLTDRIQHDIVCFATLIEGSGFWASTIRSLVTGYHALGRRSFRLKTFADIDALSHWVAPIHSETGGVRVEAAELANILAWVLSLPAAHATRA